MEDTKKTRPSKHSRTDAHMHSQRLWQCAHRACTGSEPDGVPALRGEMDTRPHPSPRSYFQLITAHANGDHWVYKLFLRADPLPSRRWPTQNELGGSFGGLSRNALPGIFILFI